MAKLKLSSLFSSSSSSSAPASTAEGETTKDIKKSSRRSFSALSASLLGSKDAEATNGTSAAASFKSATPSVAPGPAAAAPATTSEMIALAQKITKETEKLEAYMKEHDLPMPSFDADAPADFPKLPDEIAQSRKAIISATKELGLLAHGPRESVRWGIWEFLDTLALAAINHYRIAKLVPLDGTPISLASLQALTPLDPINLARLVRLAITNKIFYEPTPGHIAHTAASKVLAEDTDLQAWVGFNGEDILPASAHVLQALQAHPEATSLTRTGFQFAFNTVDKEPMFVTFGKDPNRAKRMGKAMVSLTGGEGYEPSYFLDVEKGGYDFSEIDARGGTLVDVGGSHGFMCVALAEKYRNMRFVVQDLQRTVDSAPKPISADPQVAERITLLAHDFFTEQVTKDADVYFFRWIMHNYSTPYALQILRNLIPALKPGARIVINDHCLYEGSGQEDLWDEKVMRRMDVVMLSLLNAQERTESEFRELFAKATGEGQQQQEVKGEFVFKGVTRPKGCRMSIVEAVWQLKEEKEEQRQPAAVTEVKGEEGETTPATVAAAPTADTKEDEPKTEEKAE
ncbi:S-adenosyl-L-methionine-dependent methyltransferase [Triangularia setosa]|uniref:S-adenosyl-L-methionine-dependent methyltransferase n=1 Tax=Triangularia setosa TaxID=2587417 RepID=A0AAN6WD25_9PEZI|nr:S-adenosyl-L-methionine-dependent methyltransferase [Podospora setosa]